SNSSLPACSRQRVPQVRLAFERTGCVRNRGEKLVSPEAIAEYVGRMYGCRPQETVIGLYFDSSTRLIAVHEVSLGGVANAMVAPKVLFGGALTAGATGLVLIHNHPSGQVQPSSQDIQLTDTIAQGCKVLAITFMDHLIVGRGGDFYSFVMHGKMPR